jgi:hypothetical protein
MPPVVRKGGQMNLSYNRLTIIGSPRQVKKFAGSRWKIKLGAQLDEPLEITTCRLAWQFKTASPPLEQLKALSRHWPQVTLLLDFEVEAQRIKGLAKAKAGELDHCEIGY